MNRQARFAVASFLAATALLLLATGCSSDKATRPTSSSVAAPDPRFATFLQNPPEARPQGLGGDVLGGLTSDVGGLVSGAGGLVSGLVNGALGGQLTSGRFTVTFSAGAFQGIQNISLVEKNGSYVECQLLPEGLRFDAPVTLEIHLDGTTADTGSATVYWYNPSTGDWVDIGGQYQAATHSVKATLAHFSDYRGGRAGW